MKRTMALFALLLLAIQIPVSAQDLRLGGGLSYGTEINNVGIQVQGDIRFFDQWSINSNSNLFFSRQDSGSTFRWTELNIDGHYYFEVDRYWHLYPVFGINFASASERVDNLTFSNTGVGLNIGFGSEYMIDQRLSAFAQVRYALGSVDQTVLTFGLQYLITY